MLRRLRSGNQRGDTIVEVMIVLAVLGLALGISYATANRSLLNTRQAQENSEASELAQSQVEGLRSLSSIITTTDPNYIYKAAYKTTPFCLSGGNVVNTFTGTKAQLNNYGIYPAACYIAPYYHVSVTYATGDTFTVQVIWDDVIGSAQDNVTLTYKVHKPN